jgi:hypothetical protein
VLDQVELAKQQVTTPPIPTWSRTMWFLLLFPLERKVTWASISVSRGDHHRHKGNCTRPSWKQLSAMFPELYQRWQTWLAANGDYFERGCGYV